jgi:prevent-host-death family protein
MHPLTFRNSHGHLMDVPSVAASRFRNEFGAIFEQAALGGAVAITKHETPKAVLLSYAEFKALVNAATPGLEALEAQFDGLLTQLSTPAARRGMAAAFGATPAVLGRAAVKAAAASRKR